MTRPPKDRDAASPADRPEAEEDPDAHSSFASPPCFMHELDPAYLGYLDRGALASRLGALLEEGRAVAEMERLASRETAGDEARAALDRARDRIVRKIREILPRIADDGVHRTLSEMLAVCERRIARRRRLKG